MATAVRITVACDDRQCHEQLAFEARNSGGLTLTQVLRTAEDRHGWKATAAQAFCPEHRPALKLHKFTPSTFWPDTCDAHIGRGRCRRLADHPIHATGDLS